MRIKWVCLVALLLIPFVCFASMVLVTIPPQREWIEGVAAGEIEVEVLVPRGADPHSYELSPRQMRRIEEAEIYFAIGSGLEFEVLWLERIKKMNPKLEVITCSKGIRLIEGDPHVWLSLRNAQRSVAIIARALSLRFPDRAERIGEKAEAYCRRLRKLDQKIASWMGPFKGRAFLSYHPAWGYFARDYGLRQLVIEEGGKEPTPRLLLQRISEAKREGIKVVFISPRSNRRTAEVIARELGGEVRVIDPLRGDYLKNMEEVAREILRSFKWTGK